MSERVLVIGGGLAGLAAAVALAPRGCLVTVLESRQRLGGRASSFTDAESGQPVDTCQHVSMGCCTNLDHFFRTVGAGQLLEPQKALWFLTPDRRRSEFRADPLPAPFHLARAFLRAHYLGIGDKLRIAYGLARLRFADPDADSPFVDWLKQHRQTRRGIERFWAVVLVSALNESVERVGLKYARKVFVDGFLRHRRGFEVQVPSVPLVRLYGEELQSWLTRHGVALRLGVGVKSLDVREDRVVAARLRDGSTESADWYVCAVPSERLLDLLPPETVKRHAIFASLRHLEASPITSVHLWFDRPITELPHAVLLDGVGQWLFNRGEAAPGEHYVQVVVSAARGLRGQGREAVRETILTELRRHFPAATRAVPLRVRVVTEHAATFSAVPGVDRWRPGPVSPIRNLLLAGDWTATGWPATMEGAVRSGYRAAESLLAQLGRPELLVQPELGEPLHIPSFGPGIMGPPGESDRLRAAEIPAAVP